MELRNTSNCGMKELFELTQSPRTAADFVRAFYSRPGIVIFSDSKHRGRGDALMRYVNKRKSLGRVIRSRYTRNPRTGNMIAAFVWTL